MSALRWRTSLSWTRSVNNGRARLAKRGEDFLPRIIQAEVLADLQVASKADRNAAYVMYVIGEAADPVIGISRDVSPVDRDVAFPSERRRIHYRTGL
jgi:hypothetical protein